MNEKLKNGLKTAFNVAALVIGGTGLVIGGGMVYEAFFTEGCKEVSCMALQYAYEVASVATTGVSGLLFWLGYRGVKGKSGEPPQLPPPPAP